MRNNPLDKLLMEAGASAFAESRNVKSLSNAKRDSVGMRVYKSIPIGVLVIAGALLLVIGVMIGQRLGSQRDEIPSMAQSDGRVTKSFTEIVVPNSPTIARTDRIEEAPTLPIQEPPVSKAAVSLNSHKAAPLTSEEVYNRARPAVVQVVLRNSRNKNVGHGTGFFVRDDSTVVTNFHVIAGALTAEVELHDGTTRPVFGVAGFDPIADVAVLKIDGTRGEIQPLRLSDTPPDVRGKVSVIGYPLDLGITNTNGEVTGLDGYREKTGRPWVQIDAQINPGNSGSPVLNGDGLVIGVATFIDNRGEKLHFASPASIVTTQLAREVPFQKLSDLLDSHRQVLNSIRAIADEKSTEAAEAELSQLPDWYQHLSDYWIIRGDFAERRGFVPTAISAFHKARLRADDPSQLWAKIGNGYLRLGQIYQSPNQYNEAAQAFQTGITANPKDDACWRGLGNARKSTGRWSDAAEAYRRSLEFKPKQALAHGELADVLFELKDFEGSHAEYKTALNLEPENYLLNLGYGIVLRRMGRYSEAMTLFGKSVNIAKDNDSLRLKAKDELERTRSLKTLFGEKRKAESDGKPKLP